MSENITEIEVDLEPELIINLIDNYAKSEFSPPSYSIIEEALKNNSTVPEMTAKLGEAVLNEMFLTAIKLELKRNNVELPDD